MPSASTSSKLSRSSALPATIPKRCSGGHPGSRLRPPVPHARRLDHRLRDRRADVHPLGEAHGRGPLAHRSPLQGRSRTRGDNGEVISKRMSEWTAERTTEQALAELEKAKVPAGPLYTPQQALDDASSAESRRGSRLDSSVVRTRATAAPRSTGCSRTAANIHRTDRHARTAQNLRGFACLLVLEGLSRLSEGDDKR
jgi:crotonobetainyl-CoA:carnitine CoA-transferase CaiB-like acyl-CoA transferase